MPAVRTEFPHELDVLEYVPVALSDGVRLMARVWLPRGAATAPVPAILEAVPYRIGDGTARRDTPIYRYLAGHRYAGVRVDLRGSGESEGLLTDEELDRGPRGRCLIVTRGQMTSDVHSLHVTSEVSVREAPTAPPSDRLKAGVSEREVFARRSECSVPRVLV